MRAIDNFELLAPFIDTEVDGDTFWYTVLLDRSKNKDGDRSYKMLRSFVHENRCDLESQMPSIRRLCDNCGTRAYIRLTPRSYHDVGKLFAKEVLEKALNGIWRPLENAYARASGRSCISGRRVWLYDVDEPGDMSEVLKKWLQEQGHLVAVVPTRKGEHFIVKPHDSRFSPGTENILLHKDSPTVLYIPAEGQEP